MRSETRRNYDNARKFAKGALELATFALLLSVCIVTLVLL